MVSNPDNYPDDSKESFTIIAKSIPNNIELPSNITWAINGQDDKVTIVENGNTCTITSDNKLITSDTLVMITASVIIDGITITGRGSFPIYNYSIGDFNNSLNSMEYTTVDKPYTIEYTHYFEFRRPGDVVWTCDEPKLIMEHPDGNPYKLNLYITPGMSIHNGANINIQLNDGGYIYSDNFYYIHQRNLRIGNDPSFGSFIKNIYGGKSTTELAITVGDEVQVTVGSEIRERFIKWEFIGDVSGKNYDENGSDYGDHVKHPSVYFYMPDENVTVYQHLTL